MKIIIVGAGFAGLSALLKLRKLDIGIKLIEKSDRFCYTPSLHLCLGDPEYQNKISIPLKDHFKEFFVNEKVTKVESKRVITDRSEYDFDYLVLATGATPNYFGNKSFMEHALPLKSFKDAEKINTRLNASKRVTVIGGGYTGVEVASVLSRFKRVSLIHPLDRLLENLPAKAGESALKFLKNNRAEVFLNEYAENCTGDEVILKSGKRIKSDMCILSAGILPNDSMIDHGSELNQDCSIPGMSNVYLVGDAGKSGRIPTAHNAMIEGRLAADSIAAKIRKEGLFIGRRGDWQMLAVALGRHGGMITTKKAAIDMPLTGFFKWMIERRIMFEFKRRMLLPI